jgi:hypothetical protein
MIYKNKMVTLKNLILKYIGMKNINILKRKCHFGINVDIEDIETVRCILTTYFDGNFFLKRYISMIFCGFKHIIITHFY